MGRSLIPGMQGMLQGSGHQPLVPWATLQQLRHLPVLPGSPCPTCLLSLARNTCAQQLPRAKGLFEIPYPVWELFQMKSRTLPCIKTIFFFIFLKREKDRRATRSRTPEKQSIPVWPSPCPAACTPCDHPHPCLLPPWAAGQQ